MIHSLTNVAGPKVAQDLRLNAFTIAIEAVVVGIGFTLLVPILRNLLAGSIGGSWALIAVLAGVSAFYGVMRFFSQVRGYKLGVALAEVLFDRLGAHIAKLPLGWFDASQTGRLGRLVSQGIVDVMGVPAHLLRPLITGLVTPATVVVCILFFDWRLAIAALACLPLAIIVHRWCAFFVQRADKRHDAAAVEAANQIIEYAQAQALMRAYGRTDTEATALDNALVKQRDAARSQVLSMGIGLSGFVLVIQLGFTIILLLGTSLALNGAIDAPELVALLILTVRFVEPIFTSAELGSLLRISQNSLDRMDSLLSAKPLPEPIETVTPSGSEIALDHVCFAYDQRPVLRGISFETRANTMTAIVGPSGAGKTTILRLIARFWDVTSGTVRLGGTDVRQMSTAELMSSLSIVFQDVYLLEGSIADNIRLGHQDASDDEVIRAARLARVDEIIARLPEGIESQVGEGGTILSGGERQRISIARALLKNAPLVLLDEVTSALDPINESAVQTGLRSLTRNKTLIVVAHRLHTIRKADQILFLEGGEIVERGSHEALLHQNGRYAAFWNSRMRASRWRLGE